MLADINRPELLAHAQTKMYGIIADWDTLSTTADYRTPTNGPREAALETLARSFLCAVPLIASTEHSMHAEFYAYKLLAYAQNPLYTPMPGIDQATVEIAGICSCLLILDTYSKSPLLCLTQDQQQQVLDWLSLYCDTPVRLNNWVLLKLVIQSYIATKRAITPSPSLWLFIDECYTEKGLYHDGLHWAINYYSSYGFQWYNLVLLLTTDLPAGRKIILLERAAAFVQHYSDLLAAGPLPVVGRSQCYKEAASAALALAFLAGVDVPNGRALMLTNYNQWFGTGDFENVKRDTYNCAASPMWRFKWLWQLLIPETSTWWK